ncbi:MAG: glucuronate isomerase, partial [Candidatus Sumerlaeota bacterium]
MTKFLSADFLLESKIAQRLYHENASDHPIIDFHNHLSPQVVAENKTFRDLTAVWLDGDHYKWRAMRSNGVPENEITGKVSPRAGFDAWAATVPRTAGNP